MEERNRMIAEAVRNVVRSSLAAGALGVGYGLLKQPTSPIFNQAVEPTPVRPIEVMSARIPAEGPPYTPPKKKRLPGPVIKEAGVIESAIAKLQQAPGEPASFWKGQQIDPSSGLGKMQIPWYGTAALGLPVGAFMVGHGITNRIADAKRRKNIEDSVESSREQLLDTLSGQTKIAKALDRIFDGLNKKAIETPPSGTAWIGNMLQGTADAGTRALTGGDPKQFASSWGGGAASIYGPLALLASIGAGSAVYDHVRKRDADTLIAQEARRRAARRAAQAPIETFAVPVAPSA